MGALGDSRQHAKDTAVNLSGIRLSGNREAVMEAHLFRDPPVRLAALLMIAVKQLQKAGLGSRRSLGAQKLHRTDHMIQILQIQAQIH